MVGKNIKRTLTILLLVIPSFGSANTFSVGYELGEMALNEFKYFAGEAAYRFDNTHALRVTLFNVVLSERHLSSSEASVVDGDNVAGRWRGFNLYYDYPLYKKLFLSPSIGYHENKYTHQILGTSVNYSTATTGMALSFLGDDVLGIEELYWRFSLTLTYNIEEADDAVLGETRVNGGSFAFIPLIFIGYEFK